MVNLELLFCLIACEDVVFCTCLQQRFLVLVRHGRHFPSFSWLVVFVTLLFLIVVCPMRSLRFLLRRNATTGLAC